MYREGNFVILEEDWEENCELQWKSKDSAMWREFWGRNVIRFIISPAQKRYKGKGASYWRLCGEGEANHYHIFWECPKLSQF